MSTTSSPEAPSGSRGSSVSTGLQEEYEELLRYAVVTPVLNGRVTTGDRTATPSQRQTRTPGVVATRVSHLNLGDDSNSSEPCESTSSSPSAIPLDPHNPPPPPQQGHMVINANMHSHTRTQGHNQHISAPHLISPPVSPLSPPPPSPPDSQARYTGDDIDPELARLDMQLDTWCQDLKTNVLAEFQQFRMRLREQLVSELQKARERQGEEMAQLHGEVDRSRQLLVTYEQSMNRKDQVINSLTRAVQKQKERVELQRVFSAWKMRHIDEKREMFTTSLASLHHRRKLKRRILRAWFGIIQGRWKKRVERACQARAEEVCRQIAHDYEERLAAAHRSHEEVQAEMVQIKEQRDVFADNMKTAFMRGVCALNMEAMTMFKNHETGHTDNYSDDGHHDNGCQDEMERPTSSRQQPVIPLLPINSDHGPTITHFTHPHSTTGTGTGRRVCQGNGKQDGSGKTRGTRKKKIPSVVVERHYPETHQ